MQYLRHTHAKIYLTFVLLGVLYFIKEILYHFLNVSPSSSLPPLECQLCEGRTHAVLVFFFF